MTDIGRQLLNVPMGDMIREMAFAIADGQHRLDASSIENAEMMGGIKTYYDDEGNIDKTEDSRVYFGADYYDFRSGLNQPPGSEYNVRLASIGSQRGTYFKIVDESSGFAVVDRLLELTEDDVMTAGVNLNWNVYRTFIENCRSALSKATAPGDQQAITDLIIKNNDENEASLSVSERIPIKVSMLELGFAPTFYQFVDTIIEVKISISITQTRSETGTRTTRSGGISFNPFRRRGRRLQVSTTQVNANFSSKYSYTAEGSSLIRTKLVPVPVPEILERRIEALMEREALRNQVVPTE